MSTANGSVAAVQNQVISLFKGMEQSVANDAGSWSRVFTKEGVHPFDDIEWKIVDAEIRDPKGKLVFEQKAIEVPFWWTQNTINVVADKYFRIINGARETSAKQMFSRVVKSIRDWADEQNYFNTDDDAKIFEEELIHALLHQYGAFNSPVWFNLGVPGRKQQVSACFISSVEDSIDGIMSYQKAELDIFKSGSGSGANLSTLRSSYEKIHSGSYTTGPLAWMKGLDQYAGAMKSGGGTRNAAKMAVLDMDHPDILVTRDGRPGFIRCKAGEEKLAHDLVNVGYNAAYDDPNGAYKRVQYQNANISVSVPDSFMQAMIDDGVWHTKTRKDKKTVHTYKARDLWKEIAQAAWVCGDPGIQFTDSINKWHTTPVNGPIKSSNPCSEFLHCDDTACNLCAVNLTKFFDDSQFNSREFKQAVRLFSTSQMAIVAKAEYPTEKIWKNSLKLRPIGINYGNLGSLLMRLGYGYDSDEGRAIAARMASLLTGIGYLTSAKLAARVGAFEDFEKNREPMLNVMRMHQEADSSILRRWNLESDPLGNDVISTSANVWKEVVALGTQYGYSVSQCSLQAPLGTISFLMGMDTTGIEPAFSLVSYKSLVGGGYIKLVNGAVRDSLVNLGYSTDQVSTICKFVEDHDCIEGAPGFKPEHLPIFDCAMPQGPSGRYLTPMSHIKMMAAIQPLITCAQSKTVNLPNSATVDEIADIYTESWRLGLKCIALYRDGCKASQPLSTKVNDSTETVIAPEKKPEENKVIEFPKSPKVPQLQEVKPLKRSKLPADARGMRHRFTIDGYKGYIQAYTYPDGRLGEVFIKWGKGGSTISGLTDGFAKLLSISLQYGIPLPKLIDSFIETRFEPSGVTDNKEIRFAKSFFDYLFKWVDVTFYDGKYSGLDSRIKEIREAQKDVNEGLSKAGPDSDTRLLAAVPVDDLEIAKKNLDSPPCSRCGNVTRRAGSCYLCTACGVTSGCS